jgi:TfoX/Sxy family transcriptional regulator of competence genes
MAYDEKLADRVREALADIPKVEEKKMFRGVTFMVDDKMCISVSGDELMLRLDPEMTEQLVEENGTRPMIHGGKHMKGFIYISPERFRNRKELDHWVQLALDYNPIAKSSKK